MNFYAVFHLNLMFSSIPEESRMEVITRCYWPLLRLAESGVPVGVELTGLTAEIIADLDPAWIAKLRDLLAAGAVELVGSGYAQIIGPLVPARVNRANLALGQDRYQSLLGVRPRIALVNEMTYSGGLVDLYLEAGFDALIMEWNNAARFHDWPADRQFRACEVSAADGRALPLLWADTMFFQQLQRVVHGAITEDDYHDFVARHAGRRPGDYAAFYCNDAEAFGFRPGRFDTEEAVGPAEWDTLAAQVGRLRAEGHRFLFPSEVLASAGPREPVQLESPEQPIVVKKQRKYNANRWALSGRDNLAVNSRCHRLARTPGFSDAELCALWSSDFRTHITPARWEAFRRRLDAVPIPAPGPFARRGTAVPRPSARGFRLEDASAWVELDPATGLTLRGFGRSGEPAVLGSVPHGTLSIIEFGADFFSGNVVIHRPGERLKSSLDRHGGTTAVTAGEDFVRAVQRYDWATIDTTVALRDGAVLLARRLELPRRAREIIRFFHFSFPPSAWDPATLFYATHNGGGRLERFPLAGRDVDHVSAVSWLTSSEFCLGMTEGIFAIGDRHRTVRLEVDPAGAWILPKVAHREFANGEHVLRLEYSAQEIDETFVPADEPVVIEAAIRLQILDPIP